MQRGLLTFIQCCREKIQQAITVFCIVCFERGLDDISKCLIPTSKNIFNRNDNHISQPTLKDSISVSLSSPVFIQCCSWEFESWDKREFFFHKKIQRKNSPPAWMLWRVLKTCNVGRALSRRGGQVVKLTEMNSSLSRGA